MKYLLQVFSLSRTSSVVFLLIFLSSSLSSSLVSAYEYYDLDIGWLINDQNARFLQGLSVVGNISTSGSIMTSGSIGRGSHSSGFLAGSYNNVGANDAKTNPIYTIGTAYAPTDTALGNMYGIGYSHSNFW